MEGPTEQCCLSAVTGISVATQTVEVIPLVERDGESARCRPGMEWCGRDTPIGNPSGGPQGSAGAAPFAGWPGPLQRCFWWAIGLQCVDTS